MTTANNITANNTFQGVILKDLLVKRDNIEGTVVTTQELAKKFGEDNRKQLLRDYNIPVIPDPGIPEIKQVELYNKFRPLIPKEYQDITCPHPGDAILNKIKNERNEKARYRASRKRKQKKNESHITDCWLENAKERARSTSECSGNEISKRR